ncbi:MAG TPA: hypothetical protein VMP01_00985, partial [Pirellulaceae bacterium]|nr:hypothetical protein [Pirellulaceae bacterium]
MLGGLVVHDDHFLVMLDHAQPALRQFQLFADEAIEASRPGMTPHLRRDVFLAEGMVSFFSRDRGIDGAGASPARRPRRPRFRLIRFRSRRGQLQLVVGSGGDKAFAPRAVQLAFQTGHFRDEFVDPSQELIDARFQRFDLLGLSQNQG